MCVCVCEGGFTGHPTWEQEREGKSRTPNLNQNIGVLDLEKGPIFKVLVGIFVHRMLQFPFFSVSFILFRTKTCRFRILRTSALLFIGGQQYAFLHNAECAI